MKCHVALTPTWNESAWFADYILPMGHAGERHDLMSQETHAGQWIAFRQPVRRVAMEKMGQKIERTYEANPGEVWEENEFWIDLSIKMDPDGSLGIRKWFESPYRPGEIINIDEYYQWIFENRPNMLALRPPARSWNSLAQPCTTGAGKSESTQCRGHSRATFTQTTLTLAKARCCCCPTSACLR